jgi:flagellar motor switch protein FliG
MVRLHGRNHMKLSEAWNVHRSKVLRVLDAKTAIAWTIFVFEVLVKIENRSIRSIPNGVDCNLQASLVRIFDFGIHLIGVLQLVAG